MGEGRWRTTHHWPLRGAEGFDLKRLYLLGDQRLVDDPRVAPPGQDEYTVDFSHSTGRNNRWLQGIFAEDVGVHYEDRADAPVLSYLSEPLESPLTVVGFPEVRLFLASTHTDGALHVYLEDVAPSGRVTYITEGVLRLSHRLADWGSRAPGFRNQSHAREYARPMEPGVREEIHLKLEPTAVQFAAGHRIRISIAGADAASFERLPAEGDPVLTVFWGGAGASYIELPVLE
jgi:putative CocE/NonD family hydrolase